MMFHSDRDGTQTAIARMSRKRWSPLLSAVAASLLTAGLLNGIATANSSNPSYTGCLTTGGSLTSVALGDDPARPCAGDSTQISWNRDTGQQQFDELREDLDALLAVIDIDPGTGDVTIASESDLIFESGDTDEVKVMDELMVMDDTTLDGDTTLMEDATVMGETSLEGDTTLMDDAEFMGDVTIEGGLVLPDTAVNVISGVLTPTSSSVTITGFTGSQPLGQIAEAAPGTILEIHFGISSDEIDTAGGAGYVQSGGAGNINLRQRPGDPFLFERGHTLRLVSRGTEWDEVSRSSGHVEAFTLERRLENFSGTTTISAQCTDPIDESDPTTARQGSVLLLSSGVSATNGAEILSQTTEVDSEGVELVTAVVNGPNASFNTVVLTLRCLSI